MGKFGTEGALFALQDDQSASPLRLHMLPESLAHLNAEDADTTSSSIKPDLRILRPRLPEYCVSLIRCLEDYPLGSEDRLQPERYLSILLAVGAYKETYFDKIYELEEETESDEQFEIRRASALEVIESWTMREEIEAYRVKLKDVMFSTPSGHPAEARRHNDDWEAKL